MKTSTKFIIAIILTLTIKTITAQVSADFLGVLPNAYSKWGRGGFAMNILSPVLNSTDVIGNDHIECRLGGGFYFAGLNQNTVSNVPLIAPQTGNALVTLTNRTYGLNGIARFSLPYSNKIIPYCDVFAGLRGFTSNMNIAPDASQNGCNTCNSATSENIANINELDYGATGGVMISLGKSVKLNAGLTYSDSNHLGKIINVTSAQLQAGSIAVEQMNAPTDMLLATLGLTFCFDGTWNNWTSDHYTPSSSSPSYNNYHNYSYPSSSGHCSGGGHSNVSVHISSGRAK